VATRSPAKPVKSELTILRSRVLSAIPWVVQGFSTRSGGVSRAYRRGDLNLGFTKDDKKSAVEHNRRLFLGALDTQRRQRQDWPVVTLRQVHSDIIHVITSPRTGLVGDGLVTNQPGILLAIQTADCLPVVIVDAKRRAVGAFHAGWRGTIQRIVEKGIGALHMHFGSRPADLKVAIGPGIHKCCYEVGNEVRNQFYSQFPYAGTLFHEVQESDPVREKYPLLFLTARAPGHGELPKKIFLNLVEANRQQALSLGVPARNIEASELCTSCCSDLLFSHRGEKGKTGRMMGVVGIRA